MARGSSRGLMPTTWSPRHLNWYARPLGKVSVVIRSGKACDTGLGTLSLDKNGDVSNAGYLVNGKKKDRYVLYTWKKGPDGKISYFENE